MEWHLISTWIFPPPCFSVGLKHCGIILYCVCLFTIHLKPGFIDKLDTFSAHLCSCFPYWEVVWKLLIDSLLLSGLLLNVSFLFLRELSLMYRSSDAVLTLGASATDPVRSLESLSQAMIWRWEGATLLQITTDFISFLNRQNCWLLLVTIEVHYFSQHFHIVSKSI